MGRKKRELRFGPVNYMNRRDVERAMREILRAYKPENQPHWYSLRKCGLSWPAFKKVFGYISTSGLIDPEFKEWVLTPKEIRNTPEFKDYILNEAIIRLKKIKAKWEKGNLMNP